MVYLLLPSGTLDINYAMCTLQAVAELQPEYKNAKDRCIVCYFQQTVTSTIPALSRNA